MIKFYRKLVTQSLASSILFAIAITTVVFVIAIAIGFMEYNFKENIIVILICSIPTGIVGHYFAKAKFGAKDS